MSEQKPIPKIWYLGHVILGIITGLVCYVLYKETHPKEAKSHLLHSIWLGFILPGVVLIGTTIGMLLVKY